jgi:hypothetical protein
MRRLGLLMLVGALGCGSTSPEPQSAVNATPTPKPRPKPEPEDVATLDDVRAFLSLPELAYARAFAINVHTEYSDHEDLLVDDLGQLNPDRVPEAGALLSEAQLAELMRIATGGDGDGLGPAYCFYPHHAVALYDAKGAILGELTFCFMCGRMQSTFEGLGDDAVFRSLEVMLEELDLPLELPLPGLPPTLGRPAVKRIVGQHLSGCSDGVYPALSFAVHVGSDGFISQVDGLDGGSKVSACLHEALTDERYTQPTSLSEEPAFAPAQAASVHRFEFPASAGAELER